MNVAYVTTYNARSLKGSNEWSGTGYYIAKSLSEIGVNIDFLGPLSDPLGARLERKLRRIYYSFFHQKNYQKDSDPRTLKCYARQVSRKLSDVKADIVLSATVGPISYLECSQPIVFWADATFAGIANFYPLYSNLPSKVAEAWHHMERLALQNSTIAIFSSDWAANSAIKEYGADPNKVKVVPFGANIEESLSFESVQQIIEARPSDVCKLLFLGVDWHRKGGDKAYQIVSALNKLGLRSKLTIVGCQPQIGYPLPNFVESVGFISKASNEGRKRLQKLISESHFLILPSIADCTPIVFSEANSLGTPCLSTNVGGISTIVKNDLNGYAFSCEDRADKYCDYIQYLFSDYSKYKQLAYSSFSQYQKRLSWKAASLKVKELLIDCVG